MRRTAERGANPIVGVGFVGGMDIPLIRKFLCGYEQGAKEANSKVEVSSAMTGTTPSAWCGLVRGGELAIGVDSTRNELHRCSSAWT